MLAETAADCLAASAAVAVNVLGTKNKVHEFPIIGMKNASEANLRLRAKNHHMLDTITTPGSNRDVVFFWCGCRLLLTLRLLHIRSRGTERTPGKEQANQHATQHRHTRGACQPGEGHDEDGRANVTVQEGIVPFATDES